MHSDPASANAVRGRAAKSRLIVEINFLADPERVAQLGLTVLDD